MPWLPLFEFWELDLLDVTFVVFVTQNFRGFDFIRSFVFLKKGLVFLLNIFFLLEKRDLLGIDSFLRLSNA